MLTGGPYVTLATAPMRTLQGIGNTLLLQLPEGFRTSHGRHVCFNHFPPAVKFLQSRYRVIGIEQA